MQKSNIGIVATILTTFVLAATPTPAKELLYVGAEKSADVQIVDAQTFEKVGQIAVNFRPDDVVGSPDGKLIFVNAIIPSNEPVGYPEGGFVSAYSTATNRRAWTTFIDGMPQHMSVSKDSTKLYELAGDKNWIYVIDTRSGKVIDRIRSLIGNHGSELSEDGKHLYVGNGFQASGVYVYDVDTGALVKRMLTRAAVRPLKIDKDEKYVYYQLSFNHGVEVRDIATNKVVNWLELPDPKGAAVAMIARGATTTHGLAITPDSKMLLAASSASNSVTVYSLPDLKQLAMIPIGDDPNWIRVRSDSKFAFISNRGSDSLSVVDLVAMKEMKQVPTGKSPARLDIVNVADVSN